MLWCDKVVLRFTLAVCAVGKLKCCTCSEITRAIKLLNMYFAMLR